MSQYESHPGYWVHVPDELKIQAWYLTPAEFATVKEMITFLEEIGPYHPIPPLPDGTLRWTIQFDQVQLVYTVAGFNVRLLDLIVRR